VTSKATQIQQLQKEWQGEDEICYSVAKDKRKYLTRASTFQAYLTLQLARTGKVEAHKKHKGCKTCIPKWSASTTLCDVSESCDPAWPQVISKDSFQINSLFVWLLADG
jgi:hypothetical protein